jgi:lipopolysaccharide export system ATP-binding protein
MNSLRAENLAIKFKKRSAVKDVSISISEGEIIGLLGPNSSEITEAKIVKGKITYLWTVLVDSKAKALKGYGDLPEDIARLLDSLIDPLLKIIDEIK